MFTFMDLRLKRVFHIKLVQKDKAIASWVRKHKRNETTFKVLFEKYMRLTSEKSLPRNLRHFSSDLN